MNCEAFFDEQDDNEDYDEFLFQSIKRYDTLQMFNLENIPHHLLQIDDVSLCVVSKRSKGENSELLKLKLPAKLVLPPEEEGRSKGNDFKVMSGIYTENLVYKIDKLENNKVITSEYNVSGFQVYSFTDSSLGSKNKNQKLDITPWTGADFAVVNESSHIICSKCCHKSLLLADISVEKNVNEIEHPFRTLDIWPEDWPEKVDPCSVNNIKPMAFNTHLIAILSIHSGDVVLHDLRTKDSFISLPGICEKLSKEVWTLSGCNQRNSSPNYFGILSNTGSFCIYDLRKNSIVIQNVGDMSPIEDFDTMKLKFNNRSDNFSISGLNSCVEIYKLSEKDFDHIFTHNGHCPSNLPSTVVTDHIWLQTSEKEYIVSVCNNRTLNCWDYKV